MPLLYSLQEAQNWTSALGIPSRALYINKFPLQEKDRITRQEPPGPCTYLDELLHEAPYWERISITTTRSKRIGLTTLLHGVINSLPHYPGTYCLRQSDPFFVDSRQNARVDHGSGRVVKGSGNAGASFDDLDLLRTS